MVPVGSQLEERSYRIFHCVKLGRSNNFTAKFRASSPKIDRAELIDLGNAWL
jgi:hypothetical protein